MWYFGFFLPQKSEMEYILQYEILRNILYISEIFCQSLHEHPEKET